MKLNMLMNKYWSKGSGAYLQRVLPQCGNPAKVKDWGIIFKNTAKSSP